MDLIINFTPTGMIPVKKMTPHVPVSINELVEDVHCAWEAGITMVHLHARDEATEEPRSDAYIYGRIIEGIRGFSQDLVLCVSLSGRLVQDVERRAEPLRLDDKLKPDMGSLTLGSMNFSRQASANDPDTIQRLAEIMRARGVKPELEVFDSGMINYARYLAEKGLIEPPFYFNLLFGNIATAQADVAQAGLMIRDLPDDSLWSLAGLGRAQLPMNMVSIAFGGGVRVGLEDNIWFDDERTRLASNLDLIRRIHDLAEIRAREVMTSGELRAKLQLAPGFGDYGVAAHPTEASSVVTREG